MMKLVINPTLVIDRNVANETRIRVGLGGGRTSLIIGEQAMRILKVIMAQSEAMDKNQLVEEYSRQGEISAALSSDIVDYLCKYQILIPENLAAPLSNFISGWFTRGWQAPSVHQLSGFGMPFLPDDHGGANYTEIYDQMLNDHTTIDQPEVVKGIPKHSLSEIPAPKETALNPKIKVQQVLENAKQVYAFGDHDLSFSEVHGIIHACFRNQRYSESGLGKVTFRSYPSGGARHPLEVYLVSRGENENPPGVYYYNPDTGTFHGLLSNQDVGKELDEACFLKRGVRSSKFAVLISVRWFRHMWKYRYARSYKMVLLEVGHAIQSLSFAAAAAGVESYYCPSFNDSEINKLCGLDDPFEESVAVVMTLGRNGKTLEAYRDRYDTNA